MKRESGFTLIELVIVIVILGIMAAALAPLMLSSATAYNTIQDNVAVLDKQRYAIERLAREIREVNYDSGTGFAFATMTGSSMSFTRNYFDATSSTFSADTLVTVGNTGTTVTLKYDAGTVQILTDDLGSSGSPAFIGSLAFDYLDATNTAITLLSPLPLTTVRAVRITLTLSHNGQPYKQQTQVELKRFKNL